MATDVEREIRDLLAERADAVRPRADVPVPLLRRARRRRIGTALGSTLVAAGVIAAAVIGTRTLLASSASPDDVRPGGRDPDAFAVWPQTTREAAEEAQACADARDSDCTWQLDPLELVRRYAEQELRWERVFVRVRGFRAGFIELPLAHASEELALTDRVDPLTIVARSCRVAAGMTCGGVELRVERPVRADVHGIWLVTSAEHRAFGFEQSNTPPPPTPAGNRSPMPPIPQQLKDFVGAFMQARLEGSGAERFLAAETLDLYESGSGGLSLYGYTSAPGTTYEITAWERDLNWRRSEFYRVTVRIQRPGSRVTRHELLMIERLASAGWPLDHLVAYAERNE